MRRILKDSKGLYKKMETFGECFIDTTGDVT